MLDDRGANFGEGLVASGVVEAEVKGVVGQAGDLVEVRSQTEPLLDVEQEGVLDPLDQSLGRAQRLDADRIHQTLAQEIHVAQPESSATALA